MQPHRFDQLSQMLGNSSSRRGFFAFLFAGGTTGLLATTDAEAQGCIASGTQLPDICGSTQYTCCSGWCEHDRNVCCTPEGGICVSSAECCDHDPSTPIGGYTYGCDIANFTCVYGVVAGDTPTGPAQPPPPETPGPSEDYPQDPVPVPTDVPSLISQLAQARTVAYAVVGIVKQTTTASDLTNLQAQVSYSMAQGGFDGWISGLSYDLGQGTDPAVAMANLTPQYEAALTAASNFVQQYGNQAVSGGGPGSVQQVPPEVTGGGGWDIFIQLIPLAVPIITDLFNGWRSMEQGERDRVIAQFEALRWAAWSSVPS